MMTEWAVLGAGDVFHRHVGPALVAANQKISAVWSPTLAHAAQAVERFGGMLANTAEAAIWSARAVYICTPVAAHVSLAVQALTLQRHTIVEKPLNLALADLAPLQRALADCPGLAFDVAYYRRDWPLVAHLKRMIASKSLGSLQNIVVDFATPFALESPVGAWRLNPEISGGGVLADAGCHRIDYLIAMMGLPVTTSVEASHWLAPGIEADVKLRLRWHGGVKADCHFSWLDGPRDRLLLQFSTGSIGWDASSPGHLVLTQPGQPPRHVGINHPARPLEPMIRRFSQSLDAKVTGSIEPLETESRGVVALKKAIEVDRIVIDLLQKANAQSVPVRKVG
jgi:predicted dehydrogenase